MAEVCPAPPRFGYRAARMVGLLLVVLLLLLLLGLVLLRFSHLSLTRFPRLDQCQKLRHALLCLGGRARHRRCRVADREQRRQRTEHDRARHEPGEHPHDPAPPGVEAARRWVVREPDGKVLGIAAKAKILQALRAGQFRATFAVAPEGSSDFRAMNELEPLRSALP
jgi:hypothetical protein